MKEGHCKANKLSILDKRIKPLEQGYRQNIALLGNDSLEISCLLESYFNAHKSRNLIYIHTSTRYTDSHSFFKGIAYSALSEYLGKADTLDKLITQTQISLPETISHITQSLKKNNISFIDAIETINKLK